MSNLESLGFYEPVNTGSLDRGIFDREALDVAGDYFTKAALLQKIFTTIPTILLEEFKTVSTPYKFRWPQLRAWVALVGIVIVPATAGVYHIGHWVDHWIAAQQGPLIGIAAAALMLNGAEVLLRVPRGDAKQRETHAAFVRLYFAPIQKMIPLRTIQGILASVLAWPLFLALGPVLRSSYGYFVLNSPTVDDPSIVIHLMTIWIGLGAMTCYWAWFSSTFYRSHLRFQYLQGLRYFSIQELSMILDHYSSDEMFEMTLAMRYGTNLLASMLRPASEQQGKDLVKALVIELGGASSLFFTEAFKELRAYPRMPNEVLEKDFFQTTFRQILANEKAKPKEDVSSIRIADLERTIAAIEKSDFANGHRLRQFVYANVIDREA